MSLVPFVRKIAVAEAGLPTAPGAPYAVSTTGDSISVRFTPASDPSGIAGYRMWIGPAGGTLARVSGASLDATETAYTFTGLSNGTSYDVQAQAVDVYGNVGATGAIATVNSEYAGATKNWRPKNYFRPDHRGTPVKDADHEGAYDAILAHANVANCGGVVIPVPWARVENAEGTYTWDWLDDRIDYITEDGTNDLRVILNLEMYSYGTSTTPSVPQATNDAIVPDYIITAGWCGDGNGIMPKIDISGCRDRVINIMAEMFARYGNDARVEMIGLGETSRDYVGINATNYNNNWLLIAEDLVTQAAGKIAWGFIDHNGMLSNDYAKVIQMADIMDQGEIAYSTADVIGFFTNAAAPPGVSISLRGNSALLARMNYGYSTDKAYNFTNGDNTDRRLWVPCKAENQVIRPSALTNDIVRWYLDNWEKASHPVWTLRIGAGSVSYNTSLYGSSTPAPSDFSGTSTLNYALDPANAPARTDYPSGGP